VREIQAFLYESGYKKKNEKEKKRYLMFNFPLTKNSHQRKTLIMQNFDEKQDCRFWILRLVVFTRFCANRDCLLKLNMLVKSARTVLFNLCDGTHWCGWENPVVRMTNAVRTSAD